MIIWQPKRRWLLLKNSRSGTFRNPSTFFTLCFVWKISKTEKNFLRSDIIANAPLEILRDWKKNWPMLLLRIIHKSNLVHVPKPLCCGMNIQNFLHIYKTLLDEHLSKKLEGWDFSFRNGSSFCKFGSVSYSTAYSQFFYWGAPNYYDVFFIVLTPPFIDFHQSSVFSVFKNVLCENLA